MCPNYNSVIFAIELIRNRYLLGSANENWGWNPNITISVCPSQTQLLTYSLEPANEGLAAHWGAELIHLSYNLRSQLNTDT